MHLEVQDIPIIQEVLRDYQWYVENFPSVSIMPISPGTSIVYQAVLSKLTAYTPPILQSLAGKLPPGFCILRTQNGECYAFKQDGSLHLEGPTTEFQAHLWCWHQITYLPEVAFIDNKLLTTLL